MLTEPRAIVLHAREEAGRVIGGVDTASLGGDKIDWVLPALKGIEIRSRCEPCLELIAGGASRRRATSIGQLTNLVIVVEVEGRKHDCPKYDDGKNGKAPSAACGSKKPKPEAYQKQRDGQQRHRHDGARYRDASVRARKQPDQRNGYHDRDDGGPAELPRSKGNS